MYIYKELMNIAEKSLWNQNRTESTDSKLSNTHIWNKIYYKKQSTGWMKIAIKEKNNYNLFPMFTACSSQLCKQ